jgi:signal transduction histidine kinase
MKFYFTLIWFCFSFFGNAQLTIRLNEPNKLIHIGKKTSHLKDAQFLKIDHILDKENQLKFSPYDQDTPNFGPIDETVWFNALIEEYLKLAYHGLRIKPTKFTLVIKSKLDSTISEIKIISQDIGRVILNLITNAFHAVAEKANNELEGYEPSVSVATKVIEAKWVEITVKDNGGGIPDDIKDKIFQPFFTTKPTGQGTGLGLSLAYYIINAHKGKLRVVSEAGVSTEFIIELDIKT